MVVLAAVALAVGVGGLGIVHASTTRAGMLVAALWLALFARGLDDTVRDEAWVREGHRGIAMGLRDLEVLGASSPGARCHVLVQPRGAEVRWWLAVAPERCPLGAGDRLRVTAAQLRVLQGPDRPGAPDPRALARAAGAEQAVEAHEAWLAPGPIRGSIERPPDVRGDGPDVRGDRPGLRGWDRPFWSWVARERDRAFTDTRTDDGRALVAATVLGLRAALSPERRVELRAAGLGHLIAVSGLHVGIAAWLAFGVLVRGAAAVGGGLTVGVLAAVAGVILYVSITGGAASATRAGVMAAVVALGMLVRRPHHGLTTLLVACTTMAAIRPAWIGDVGFQMSAAAMAGIVGAAPGASVVSMTWRVTWAIAPVGILHFGTVCVWGLIGNLVAIPVVTAWVLPLGLLGWWASSWWGPAAWEPAALGARVVLDVAAALARLPPVPLAVIGAVAALAVLAPLLGRRWPGRVPGWPPRPFATATLAAVVIASWPRAAEPLAWLADGSPRRFTVIALGGDPRRACIDRPHGSAPSQLRTLQALGVRSLGDVLPAGDPAASALERAAAREGFGTRAGGCTFPSRADARAALRACAVFDPRGRAFAGLGQDGTLRCFVAGRWVRPGDDSLLD